MTAPGPEVFTAAPLDDDQVRALEGIAAAAWPAAERRALDGWWLRASPAPTRRVNSVFTNAVPGDMDPAARITAAEAFYRERGQPPRFQITRASLPDGLDEELARRGYEIEAPVDIQIAQPAALEVGAAADGTVRIADRLDPRWMAVYAGGFKRDVTAVIEQISGRAAFLTFEADGDVLGVALGVLESGWLGIFGMQTRPEHRGRGIGTAMLAGLADWALAEGAVGVYLQVEQDNPRARALYERCGFRTVYAYHYRTLF